MWDNSYLAEVQLALGQCLSRKVKVEGENGKGRLIIEFYGEEDLKSLAAALEKSGGGVPAWSRCGETRAAGENITMEDMENAGY